MFSKDEADIGQCDRIKHRLGLTNEVPFKQPHRRIPSSMNDLIFFMFIPFPPILLVKTTDSCLHELCTGYFT